MGYYETMNNDLSLVLFDEEEYSRNINNISMSTRITMDSENFFMMADELPTAHIIHKNGYNTLVDPQLSFWTGLQFKTLCSKAYGLVGKFYLDGWREITDDDLLFKQGAPLYRCFFIFHESCQGMGISTWLGAERNLRQEEYRKEE